MTLFFLFLGNERFFLADLDGVHMRVLVREQFEWQGIGFGLGFTPFQGVFNAVFPFNLTIVPVFLLQHLLSGDVHLPLSATLFSLEMFAAAWIAGGLVGADRPARIIGSWAVAIVCLPVLSGHPFMASFDRVPFYIDLILYLFVSLLLLKGIRGQSWASDAARALGCAALLNYAAFENPLAVMIVGPAALFFVIAIIAAAADRRERLAKSAAAAAVAVSGIASGALPNVLGGTLFTVPTFFADELLHSQAMPLHASIAYQAATFGSHLGMIAVGGSVIGGLVLLRRGGIGRYERQLLLAHLILVCAIVGGGYLLVRSGWVGPQTRYFELVHWPLYGVLFAVAAIAAIRFAARQAARLLLVTRAHRAALIWGPVTRLPWFAESLALGALITCLAVWGGIPASRQPGFPFPPRHTAITNVLAAETALSPGQAFRGSTATLTGFGDKPGGASWSELHYNDHLLLHATGNDHRTMGLWYFGIPTLTEYSHHSTPQLYFLLDRFLTRPQDRQLRNITIYTRLAPRIMRLLGIRYVISDQPHPELGTPRARLPLPQGGELTLHELEGANLGSWAATRVVTGADVDAFTRWMASHPDLEREAFAFEAIEGPLAPARVSPMVVDGKEIRIAAESDGTSLLVLPVQYSHCLTLRGPGRLVRIDLALAGIVFSTKFEGSLRLDRGPLGAGWCRLADLREMKRLGLGQTGDPAGRRP
ncbi:hypothetical protein [Magnetospirillum sp. UT-4]|uniref:hypothetical protein n=1 Tax=Magnetospirillum sp. UT-4 TaxID=2681467 RepID=UPI00157224EE|nr:hypothetical protein [Magnetospirillum sp. UT-4]